MSTGRQDDALNQPTEELPALHEDGPGPAPALEPEPASEPEPAPESEPGSAAAPAVVEPAPAPAAAPGSMIEA